MFERTGKTGNLSRSQEHNIGEIMLTVLHTFKAHLSDRKCGSEQELSSAPHRNRKLGWETLTYHKPQAGPYTQVQLQFPINQCFFLNWRQAVNSGWRNSLNIELPHASSKKATFPQLMQMAIAPQGTDKENTLVDDLVHKQPVIDMFTLVVFQVCTEIYTSQTFKSRSGWTNSTGLLK